MKSISLFSISIFLSISAYAHADLGELAKILATNPAASYSVDTKTTNDPVQIEVDVNGKKVADATATPEEFVNSVRALVPTKKIEAGGYVYLLGWQELNLVKQDKLVTAYDLLADIKDVQADPADPTETDGYISESFKLLSVVGPYVSFSAQTDEYYPGAAHPNESDDFSTVDIRQVGAGSQNGVSANLLDLVDEASLVRALKADKALHKLVQGTKAKQELAAATTVEELENALMDGFANNCYSFPGYENSISSFAIFDYDPIKNLVSVRLPLSGAAHACQAEAPTLQLGLQVTPLSDFEYLLREQVKSGDGLLMKRVAK